MIAVTNTLPNRTKAATDGLGIGRGGGAGDHEPGDDFQRGREGEQLQFLFDDFAKAILSRIVKKCGTRSYWEDWANDVAEIARKHVTRLTVAVEKAGSKEKQEMCIRDSLRVPRRAALRLRLAPAGRRSLTRGGAGPLIATSGYSLAESEANSKCRLAVGEPIAISNAALGRRVLG